MHQIHSEILSELLTVKSYGTMKKILDAVRDLKKQEQSVSEQLQDELEPLPGVPRYTNVVVG